jgi:hypothetical protein
MRDLLFSAILETEGRRIEVSSKLRMALPEFPGQMDCNKTASFAF